MYTFHSALCSWAALDENLSCVVAGDGFRQQHMDVFICVCVDDAGTWSEVVQKQIDFSADTVNDTQ